MRISSSDINAFLKCRRKWDYCSDNRQRLEPLAPVPALFLGSGVHDALEAFYRHDTENPAQFFEEWVLDRMAELEMAGIFYNDEKVLEQKSLGVAMLNGYLAEYGETPESDPSGVRIITTEHQFALPIPNTDGGLFVGRLDGLLYDQQGLAWVWETKTYTQAPRNFDHVLQQIAYVWAANRLAKNGAFAELGFTPETRVYGVLYNGLRKQKPGPRVTAPLFKREWVPRTLRELYLFENELSRIHRAMANPYLELYPSYSQDCSWCSYRAPCDARRLGEDEEWELKTNFRRQPPRGEVYQDEESE